MLVGSVFVRDGALYNGVALLDGGQRHRHALQARTAQLRHVRRKAPVSRPGRCPSRSMFRGVKLGLPICEDIWFPFVCRHLAERGARECSSASTAAPTRSTRTMLRIDERRAPPRGRNRPAARLSQPRRRAGRAGVRRRVLRPQWRWRRSRVQMPDWEEALVDHRLDARSATAAGAATAARSHALDRASRGHLSRDGARPARLCEPQPLSRRGAGPVGRDRQRALRRRSRSMRWARTGSGA